ncbi:cysteine desulfurase family protein [Spirochaeta isovalerica]|uniref:Cysteine desulfurase n=1 Tax=Spirochaeta isovalerica TaxID=150 RepID=A0A841R9U1_9SPIO|nr:cysteine desulfurase family protein [Spirochaeta isovalerica]MBB6480131.1 cysteine desulfurase [Spirochaeta isovalerica]
MIYLDWAATTPPYQEAIDVMANTMKNIYGNPSSAHAPGLEAKALLNESRKKCAEMLNCKADQIIFTSGGSESNNMIIYSLLKTRDKGEIIVCGLEHPAAGLPVQNMAKMGAKVKQLNPDKAGLIHPEKLAKAINEKTRMVIVMLLNNETGVIQPLEELIAVVREAEIKYGRPIHFHSDMVQALGKIPVDLQKYNVDSASFSAHKFGGPRGIGILFLKKDREFLFLGGGQERGMRPGTENLASIASMTRALELSLQEDHKSMKKLMDLLLEGVSEIPNGEILPPERVSRRENYCDYILSLSFPPVPGEVLARVLNEKGFAISTGSACSTNKKSKTAALTVMGFDRRISFSSVRVSIGRDTTFEEVDEFLKTLGKTVEELAVI